MANHKKSLKKKEPSTFEEWVIQWAEQIKPGPPPTRRSLRERGPPDRYKPIPFKTKRGAIMSSPMPPPPVNLKRSAMDTSSSKLTRPTGWASKRTKTDTNVTQVKDLMSFKPAMYGRTPKAFVDCVRDEDVLQRELAQLNTFLKLHVSRSTMRDHGLIPNECKPYIESSVSLKLVSYNFPPEPEVYGEEWAGLSRGGALSMVQTAERVIQNTQHYNSRSPEDSWCGQIVQPVLDLMQNLHFEKIVSIIAQNEVISPQKLCPVDQNINIPQSGRKKVDHILGLQISEKQEAMLRKRSGFSKSVNQCMANSLSSTPIFLDIEVKTVNKGDPLVQLRVWGAAGHKKREMEGWSTDLPILGIVVDGHIWNLQIGFWSPKEKKLLFGAPYHLGSTDDIVSIFHIFNNLHKICLWADDHFRKWFEKQLEKYALRAQLRRADDEDDEEGQGQKYATAKRNRERQAMRRRNVPGSSNHEDFDANLAPADPAYQAKYELNLVFLYEHSRKRGHKTCAYRGCQEKDWIEGDEVAFTRTGDPRKDFAWLWKNSERQRRRDAVKDLPADEAGEEMDVTENESVDELAT